MAWSGQNTLFRVSKLLCMTFLVFAASAVNAAPTISEYNRNVVDCAVSPSSDVHISVVPEVIQISDSHLAAVAAEFLKPPAAFMNSSAPPICTRALPAVPAAALMVLLGFLCISLVKDRRVWLAALAGLLWAGQAGIQAVPQLALRLSHRSHSKQQLGAEPTYLHYLENSDRLRSDIDGTQYIGLLHHLAGIPEGESAYRNTRLAKLIASYQHSQKSYGKVVSYTRKNTFPYLSAIISEQYRLNSLFECLALKAKQFICFSPAFIFDNLPRGPPKLT